MYQKEQQHEKTVVIVIPDFPTLLMQYGRMAINTWKDSVPPFDRQSGSEEAV